MLPNGDVRFDEDDLATWAESLKQPVSGGQSKIQFFLSTEKLLKLAEVAKRDHDRLMELVSNREESEQEASQ